jgi:hypothetical protein
MVWLISPPTLARRGRGPVRAHRHQRTGLGGRKQPRLSVAQLLAARHLQPIQSLDDLMADTFDFDEEPVDSCPLPAPNATATWPGHLPAAGHPDTDVASDCTGAKLTGSLASRLVGR